MARKQRRAKPPPLNPKAIIYQQPPKPLPNYSLSSVCPACGRPTYKLACKVRCPKCGFMWDCSEL